MSGSKSKNERAAIVCDQFSGILPQAEAFYVYSVLNSARSALLSFQRYEESLPVDGNAAIIVGSVHEGLIHVAALSRFFWPSGEGKGAQSPCEVLRQKRGEKLRAAYELTDDSPLKSRSLRNGIEHFDERLDEYMLREDSGVFVPWPTVVPKEMASDPIMHYFKLVDPDESCFVLLGKEYFFGELVEEVRAVYSKSCKMDAQGGRLKNSS